MQLKFLCIRYDRYRRSVFKITKEDAAPDDYLIDVLKGTGRMFENIAFPRYYDKCIAFMPANSFPYILRSGKFCWNVGPEGVTISEFFTTHCITEEDLIFVDTFEGGGGAFEGSAVRMWEKIYPCLAETPAFASAFQETGGFIKTVGQSFGSRTSDGREIAFPYPSTVFAGICTRKRWILNELAEALDMEPEKARCLLETIGYSRQDTSRAYMISEERQDEFFEKIDGIVYANMF